MTDIMTTAIAVICTILMLASLLWIGFIYRKSDSDEQNENRGTEIKDKRE